MALLLHRYYAALSMRAGEGVCRAGRCRRPAAEESHLYSISPSRPATSLCAVPQMLSAVTLELFHKTRILDMQPAY